jgi:hypothetical protein
MSTTTAQRATTPIPVQLSEPEFTAFIFPHLSMPKRGPKCKLGYYRVFNLPIRSINVQLPEFQAAYREPPPTPVVAGCPPVILTRGSGDVGYPHRRHS